MLSVDKLDAYYGKIQALNAISLTVDEGEMVGLLGSNGAGKSTVLKSISGLCRAKRGNISFKKQSIINLEPAAIVRLGVVLIPENRMIFPELTVNDNLKMGAFIRKDKKSIRRDFDKVFHYFPILLGRRSQYAGTLSGGEQQMLAIGRGFMAAPKLLLTDEISLGIAPIVVKEIYSTIIMLREREDLSILFVEQNIHVASELAERAYVLEKGKVVLSGEPKEVLDHEEVKRVYVGV